MSSHKFYGIEYYWKLSSVGGDSDPRFSLPLIRAIRVIRVIRGSDNSNKHKTN